MEITQADKSLAHRLFEIGVLLKGLHGLSELIGAGIIYVVSGTTMYNILTSFIYEELTEDPNDFLANLFLRHVHITTHGKDFVAFYLLVSAVVNIVIAIGLLMHRKMMFPVAKIILGAFVIYQGYLFLHTHSPWLLALITYDIAIICLIYMEYKRRWPLESLIVTT